MKKFIRIAQIISGLLFIFSGLSKAVDPLGSMYKFIDYFTAFGLDSLNGLALVLSIVMSITEFLIGFAVLSGIRIRPAAWGLLLFMLGFTPFTLVLAISNPVSDCGCFGDAIHLSNWQTFFKNIIILAFVIPVFIARKKSPRITLPSLEWFALSIITALTVLLVLSSLKNLPIVDFRPYAIGENIYDNMLVPEGEAMDEYETLLIYEKDGLEKEFTLENYPTDSLWTFVDQKTKLINKGYTPPIHDFSLVNIMGEDYTDMILADPGYTMLMISMRLDEAESELLEKGIAYGEELTGSGISFYLLTSTSVDESTFYGHDLTVLSGDETMLKTIVRDNPGYLLIKGGTILMKWSSAKLPEPETIVNNLENYENRNHLNIYLKLLIMLGVIVLIAFGTKRFLEKGKL